MSFAHNRIDQSKHAYSYVFMRVLTQSVDDKEPSLRHTHTLEPYLLKNALPLLKPAPPSLYVPLRLFLPLQTGDSVKGSTTRQLVKPNPGESFDIGLSKVYLLQNSEINETMSLNAVVRAVRATSSLDAFLHSNKAFTFDVADSCAIRGQRRRLIRHFISVFI
ncbi:unnamed protein product [Hymenolepis diminuta]|uniref:Uncharacterized protein n=1 Tax=Hymenolepis diminuta TaxID=6216 RepID=A0A3P7BA91_HYMDI|nr:unnamed protein product [Hymenolepis diminuta]